MSYFYLYRLFLQQKLVHLLRAHLSSFILKVHFRLSLKQMLLIGAIDIGNLILNLLLHCKSRAYWDSIRIKHSAGSLFQIRRAFPTSSTTEIIMGRQLLLTVLVETVLLYTTTVMSKWALSIIATYQAIIKRKCVVYTYTYIHGVSEKSVQNFVKFSSILIIFGIYMTKWLKLYATYTFSTSPHSCYCTTLLNTKY